MRIKRLVPISLLALLAAFTGTFTESARADSLRDANRLLRVTEVGKQFESMALRQTRNIIRTYSSIVSTSVNSSLPPQIKSSIATCYAEAYAWEKFESGIAEILADKFSQKEMWLLIDFYSNRSLPPMEIQSFKNAIAKSAQIEQMSAEYIFANSDGCVERDAELILGYLNRSKQLRPSLAAE